MIGPGFVTARLDQLPAHNVQRAIRDAVIRALETDGIVICAALSDLAKGFQLELPPAQNPRVRFENHKVWIPSLQTWAGPEMYLRWSGCCYHLPAVADHLPGHTSARFSGVRCF